ncbi:hypothetical protein Taro_028242 [Colocasia esculenta]|uniref:Uncharacterized protein n=1 Tax=Colocasia esculenta TaxID=4460 RepID=A0A843VTM1_COLES|nr:hypothetical protein [Colocasia esculenta]
MLCGARRRWSFLHEGPNGSALHVEVRLLSSGKARIGRTRQGGSGGETSQQQQGARRADETGW